MKIAERIAGLSPQKLALLEERLQRRRSGSTGTIPRRQVVEDRLPMSFAQERFWLLDRLYGGTPAYHLGWSVGLSGDVRAPLVERVLDEIIRRHAPLRTIFGLDGGRPVQIIEDGSTVSLTTLDLGEIPAERRAEEAGRRVAAHAQKPFDLTRGPLLRALLLQGAGSAHAEPSVSAGGVAAFAGPAVHELHVVMHHIVADGWSLRVLAREVAALLEAFGSGRPSPLPDLPIEYADYVLWQHEHLGGERGAALVDYWRRQLDGAPDRLDLPADRPREARTSHAGAAQWFPLRRDTVERVRALAQEQQATFFMALLAAYAVLLFRHSGQRDIVIGSPIANRSRHELEPLIGVFVNTLPLRVRLGPEMSFRRALDGVKEAALGAYAHQDCPFERIVSELAHAGRPQQSPLVQALFALEGGDAQAGVEAPIEADDGEEAPGSPPVRGWVKFDLAVTYFDHAPRPFMLWEYLSDLFDDATITRLAGRFRRLLASAAARPDIAIEDLDMLGEEERRRVLVEWNASMDIGTSEDTLHGLVEAQARRSPDAPALVWEHGGLSYRELDERANQLAWRLAARGVRAGDLVGLSAERSPEMMITLLSIQKAGAAYVPLDPAYPAERLAFMLQDARPALVLAEERVRGRLAAMLAGSEVEVVAVEPELRAIGASDPRRPPGLPTPDLPAYVMYTSGSSGRPKGVVVSHRAAVNHMRWMLATWPLREEDVVLARTPISFDASVWEMFVPLMGGASVALASAGALSYGAVASDIVRHRVTILQVVPSLLHALLEGPEGLRRCTTLRRVYSGGEPLSSDLARRFFEQQAAELYNLYGPTEAAIDVTYGPCDPAGTRRAMVPIGRAVSGARLYILDPRLRLVPPGVVGELYVAGVCLASGYLGQPRLTAQAFLPDPFGEEPGGRMYRTGDLARHLSSGEIDILGRADRQVKIRGFRIEPGEIEAALTRHPDVREAVVVAEAEAEAEASGGRRLVAYIVSRSGRPPAAEALREEIGKHLAPHMIPAIFVPLEALPLLPNGKIDVAALAHAGRDSLTAEVEPPADDYERQLLQIWKTILGVEQMGTQDSFFTSGGHSLLAVQVISRVRDAFDVELPLSQMFETPTVSALAGVVRERVRARGDAGRMDTEERRRVLEGIDRLSDDEVDAMLSKLISPPAAT